MITGNIIAAKLPKRGVEVANVDHIAGRIANFDPIAYAIRLPNEEVNPADKAGHRRLNGETGDDRNDPDGDRERCTRFTKRTETATKMMRRKTKRRLIRFNVKRVAGSKMRLMA